MNTVSLIFLLVFMFYLRPRLEASQDALATPTSVDIHFSLPEPFKSGSIKAEGKVDSSEMVELTVLKIALGQETVTFSEKLFDQFPGVVLTSFELLMGPSNAGVGNSEKEAEEYAPSYFVLRFSCGVYASQTSSFPDKGKNIAVVFDLRRILKVYSYHVEEGREIKEAAFDHGGFLQEIQMRHP